MDASGSTPRGMPPGFLPDAQCAATLVLRPSEPTSDAWAQALRALPAAAAVVTFEGDEGGTLLLGVTADARAFASKRLTGDGEGGKGGVDLGEVVARVAVTPVGSAFEAELVYLSLARRRMPRVYRQLMARNGVSVVALDATANIPEPVPLKLEEAGLHDAAWLLGPVETKSVTRLIDAVVDAFDLCRYPHILRQAPRGIACPYKEMGRCPAPCDGSESLDVFRARVAAAVRAVGMSAEEREAGVRTAMKEAAMAARFEEAAALKKSLERLETLDNVGPCVGTFAEFRHVVVTATGAADKSPRLSFWAGGRCMGLGSPDDMTPRLTELVSTPVRPPSTPDELEAVGAILRWAQERSGRRRVRVVRVRGAGDAIGVEAAVRAVRARRSAEDDSGMEEMEHRDGHDAAA